VDEESRAIRHLDDSLVWNEDCFKAFVKMLSGQIANLSDGVSVYCQHHPVYRNSSSGLSPRTLIDQIVYRLYGLTEEEIAIVEGSS
jgi:hypothetical protein